MTDSESTEKNKHEKYWTQAEVARRFRKSEGTIKNWRDRGLLSFFRPPGSRSVLYLMDEVKDFENQNTTFRKGGDAKRIPKPTKKKPDVSTTSNKKWEV